MNFSRLHLTNITIHHQTRFASREDLSEHAEKHNREQLKTTMTGHPNTFVIPPILSRKNTARHSYRRQ
jgi:hypothetical protein